MKLTSKERIMRIFQNKEIDRPALKLWGASIDEYLLHSSYDSVRKLAVEKSDLFETAFSPFDIYFGKASEDYVKTSYVDTIKPFWKERHRTFITPKGNLHEIEMVSIVGEPSYITEYMIKAPGDIDKLLSAPYTPYKIDLSGFTKTEQKLGTRGIVMLCLDHAGYALQRLIGSENLALFSIDCREKLEEVIEIFSKRNLEFVKKIIDTGFNGVFQWVGPELYIPPLLSPKDFEDFIYKYDKPICDEIHNSGSYVWVHCHGKVSNFVERFIDMGIDVLNPLEPPKNGDINLENITCRFKNKIGYEGNIEIQEIIQSEPEPLKELIKDCVEKGSKSGRFILCPSAGYMEYPFPEKRYIDNLILYLEYGYECVESCM